MGPPTLLGGQVHSGFGYDGSGEHRGLLTSESTGMGSSPSAFAGSYDAAGRLTSQTFPNGIVATSTFDNAGNQSGLRYTGRGTGSAGLAYTADYEPHGKQTTANGPISAQAYSYDHAGRISTVTDAAASSCTTRVYGYDTDTNRTSQTAQRDPGNGTCVPPGSVTAPPTTHTYDAGDRLTDSGYSYDSLGRTLTIPAADAGTGVGGAVSLAYYVSDWVATETQGPHTISYGLDATQNRVRTQADSATSHTTTDHYADGTDSPAWADGGDGSWTRNVTDLAGNLAATQSSNGTAQLQLTDLHGNIAATVPDNTTAPAPDGLSDYTEFGQPDNTTTNGTYGWEGTHRRATDNLNALILMGQRLYNPTTGRFQQTDPIPGGSANNYDYCNQDPINCTDLNGQRSWRHRFHFIGTARRGVYRHAVFGAGVCPIVCVGIQEQGGHFSANWGQAGVATPGLTFGWAHRTWNHREHSGSYGLGGGRVFGGYGSVGRKHNGRLDRGDWEVGGCLFCGGAWAGINRSHSIRWHHRFPWFW